MARMTGVGIVIVTLNSGQYVGACLDSALRTGAQVVVVDNGSDDATLEEIRRRPGARLIANGFNEGFAAAVNRGVRALDCAWVLLLNPDAILLGPLDDLVAACSRPGVGAAGGRLIDESGATQAGFLVRRFPTPLALALEVLGVNRVWARNRVNRSYRCLDLDYDQPAEVEQPAGAFLMVRRDLWEQLGGLDERFFPVWFEDVDFCKRVAEAGLRIRYEPGAVASHAGGHSVRGASWEARRISWYSNLLRYACKHFSAAGVRAVCAAVVVGSALRVAPEVVVQRSLKPLEVYARILGQAGAGLLRGRPLSG